MKRWLIGLILATGLLAFGIFIWTRRPQAALLERRVVLAARPEVQGFARAEAPAPITFPQDFGPHPEYQTEWWYVTGNLSTPDGRRFGYQWTVFRRGLLPLEAALQRGSRVGRHPGLHGSLCPDRCGRWAALCL